MQSPPCPVLGLPDHLLLAVLLSRRPGKYDHGELLDVRDRCVKHHQLLGAA